MEISKQLHMVKMLVKCPCRYVDLIQIEGKAPCIQTYECPNCKNIIYFKHKKERQNAEIREYSERIINTERS